MSLDHCLGRFQTLRVQRLTTQGAWLALGAGDDGPTLLLPAREVPENTEVGSHLDVFVHLDSEDLPIATRREPLVVLGEVAFLTVTELTHFGAFCDWGLPKELLVPKREQIREVRAGERHPIALFVDDTGRLAGTMKVTELLATSGDFELGEWVPGEAWRNEPGLGLFAILARTTVGLLPATEPHRLRRGEAAQFRVTHILPDGKLELSLRGPAHDERDKDGERILAALACPEPPRLSDHSSPELLREELGMSKKAFKRAVGGLLRRGAVEVDDDGFVVPARTPPAPKPPAPKPPAPKPPAR